MPIFIVRVVNQNTKEFAVNCNSQDEARVIVGQNFNTTAENPNVVLTADNTAASTEVAQADASAKWADYTSKRLR